MGSSSERTLTPLSGSRPHAGIGVASLPLMKSQKAHLQSQVTWGVKSKSKVRSLVFAGEGYFPSDEEMFASGGFGKIMHFL